MIIEFGRFILGIYPTYEAVNEEMYNLTIDGRQASLGEVQDLRKRQYAGARFWGRSHRLYEQAAFLESDELLKEADSWSLAEQRVIADELSGRVGGGPDLNYAGKRNNRECDRLDSLAGREKYAVVEYPILAVGVVGLNYELNLGRGRRADKLDAWCYQQHAIDEAIEMMSGMTLSGVETSCIPEQMQRSGVSWRGMSVGWYYKSRGERKWGGREFLALGTILG